MTTTVDGELRTWARAFFAKALGEDVPGIGTVADEFEAECFARAEKKRDYLLTCSALAGVLARKIHQNTNCTIAKAICIAFASGLRGEYAEFAAAFLTRVARRETEFKGTPRQIAALQIASALAKDKRFVAKKACEVGKAIERGCYNEAIERCQESQDSYRRNWDSLMFLNIYASRVRTVCENLDPDGIVARGCKSTHALDNIHAGTWEPEAVGKLLATQLCPEASHEIRKKLEMRLNQKIKVKTSSLFPCPKCRNKKHTYRQVQMRSGDEPATIMCTCLACGFNYEGRG